MTGASLPQERPVMRAKTKLFLYSNLTLSRLHLTVHKPAISLFPPPFSKTVVRWNRSGGCKAKEKYIYKDGKSGQSFHVILLVSSPFPAFVAMPSWNSIQSCSLLSSCVAFHFFCGLCVIHHFIYLFFSIYIQLHYLAFTPSVLSFILTAT